MDDEPTVEEKYGPVLLRFYSAAEGGEMSDVGAGRDIAIDRLCLELSENEGPLEQMRLLQESEDEWTALRALLPEPGPFPRRPGDRLVEARMEEIATRQIALRERIRSFQDTESLTGAKLLILRRLLEAKNGPHLGGAA